MTYELVVELITNKCSMKLDTLDDLSDLDLLIKKISKCYDFENAGIDTNYYRDGISTLPGTVWFNRIGYSILLSHQGSAIDGIPDKWKKYYDDGIPPKVYLDPKKYPQYWI